jgi:D,D-heptose 1,7-bisphosphate phosphatase
MAMNHPLGEATQRGDIPRRAAPGGPDSGRGSDVMLESSRNRSSLSASKRRALFLDKDGTLVDDVPYNVDPTRIRVAEGAIDALRTIRAAGFRLILVSNQSGVARGVFPVEALAAVEERLRAILAGNGVVLDGMYWGPHHPDGSILEYRRVCACRKPAPGLILQAADEHHIDLGASWMVGDILDDVEAGRRAGCRTALLDNGNETEWVMTPARGPDVVVRDWNQLARCITAEQPPLRASQQRGLGKHDVGEPLASHVTDVHGLDHGRRVHLGTGEYATGRYAP